MEKLELLLLVQDVLSKHSRVQQSLFDKGTEQVVVVPTFGNRKFLVKVEEVQDATAVAMDPSVFWAHKK